jgi:hypothetical protein
MSLGAKGKWSFLPWLYHMLSKVTSELALTPTPTPTLMVSCSGSIASSNFRVELSGSLTYNWTGLQGLPVLFSYSIDGGKSWNQLTLVSTDSNGDLLVVWLLYVTGIFLLKAEYLGGDNYSEISKVVKLRASPFGEQSPFFSVIKLDFDRVQFGLSKRKQWASKLQDPQPHQDMLTYTFPNHLSVKYRICKYILIKKYRPILLNRKATRGLYTSLTSTALTT